MTIYANSYKTCKNMNTEALFAAVCQACDCTKEEIRSSSRLRHIVIARKIISAHSRHKPLYKVGDLISRDHATIQAYRNKFEADMLDRYFRECYEEVDTILTIKNV